MLNHKRLLMVVLGVVVVAAFQLFYTYDDTRIISNHPYILSKYFAVNRSDPWKECKNTRNSNDTRYGKQRNTYDKVFNLTRDEANAAAKERGSEPSIILGYFRGINKNNPPEYPWKWLASQGRTNKCSSNCVYTLDYRMISCADLVVVHHEYGGLNVQHLEWLRQQNKQVPWAWMEHESPHNTGGQSKLRHLFQFTATYSRSSHLWISNFFVVPKEKPDTSGTAVDHANEKTKTVIIFMSNCVGFRIQFIRKLQKYINVDFFGGCNRKAEKRSCPRYSKLCEKKQKQYRFYLALENSFCEDYHTEKFYWQGLQKGLVPITFFDYNSLKKKPIVAPPKSFINILDYPNMKALAAHLNYLNNNNTAYNDYHAWRNNFSVFSKNRCTICEEAQRINVKEKKGLPTIRIDEYWNKTSQCTGYVDKMFQKYLVN